jgi:hypothetical protein
MTTNKPSAAAMLAARKLLPYHLKNAQAALSVLRMTWPRCEPEAAEQAFAIYRAATKGATVDTEGSPHVGISVTPIGAGRVPEAAEVNTEVEHQS